MTHTYVLLSLNSDIVQSLTTFARSMPNTLAMGVLWGIVALGVFITYKILDFPDLTIDSGGSFMLGAAVSAVLITRGVNPFLALLVSTVAGMLAGSVTGFLHTKLRIVGLLAGILTMYGLYSINLRVMGKPNIAMLRMSNVFTDFASFFGISGLSIEWIWLIAGLIVSIILVAIMYYFFGTEVGVAIRATGDNPDMIRALGVNTDSMKLIALFISNGIVGLAGGMVAQQQNFADMSMGLGVIVIGLASVIIGEAFFGRLGFFGRFCGAFAGSIIYRIIISFILSLQIGPVRIQTDDMKLATSVIIVIALAVPVFRAYASKRANRRKVAAA